jgi:hypothetical protein
MKPVRATLVVATLLLSSCYAPLSHTYFVPNPADGTPVPSQSCGFLKNNKNTLQRQYGEVEISVTPAYDSNDQLSVTFGISNPSGNLWLYPERVEVRESSRDVVLDPVNVETSSYGPDGSHPFSLFVTLFFAVTASDVASLKVIPHDGALHVSGNEISLEPFRFTQATSTDWYYGSINC